MTITGKSTMLGEPKQRLSAAIAPPLSYMRPPGGSVLVIAHRGGVGNSVAQNSRLAIEAAVRDGVSHIEIDVRTDVGGNLVLSHAPFFKSTDCYRLRDVLLDFPQVYVRIDIKDPRAARRVAALVNELGCFNRVYISSFWDWRIYRSLKGMRRPVPHALGLIEGSVWACLAALGVRLSGTRAANSGSRAYHAHIRLLRHEKLAVKVVKNLQQQGIQVHAWTVNTPDDTARCLRLGVDAILSDYPAQVSRWATAYSQLQGSCAIVSTR